MIPPFEPTTGNLPPGLHEATWDELAERFGFNQHRQRLLSGLRLALESLRVAGCRRVYIDGSFVTRKAEPGDFDAGWETSAVRVALLDPILLHTELGRAAQKIKFGGELLPLRHGNPAAQELLDAFQRDPMTGVTRGIIVMQLEYV